MPRPKRGEKKNGELHPAPLKSPEKLTKCILISSKAALESASDSSDVPTLVKLRHPQTRLSSLFLFSPNNEIVQEVLTFTEDKRSWFVDTSIVPGEKVHISTPIDPLFLILPYLSEATQCSPLDQIVIDEDFPETERLLKCLGRKNMASIADQRGDPSLNAFAFNEEKTLAWLQKKTERLSALLKERGHHVSLKASISANFVKSEKEKDSDESYLKYAHGMISEYLVEDLSKKLAGKLNLPEEVDKKRKDVVDLCSDDEHESKKAKVEPVEPKPETMENGDHPTPKIEKKAPVKTPTVSAKEKAMAKAAAGTKSLASFFKKAVPKV